MAWDLCIGTDGWMGVHGRIRSHGYRWRCTASGVLDSAFGPSVFGWVAHIHIQLELVNADGNKSALHTLPEHPPTLKLFNNDVKPHWSCAIRFERSLHEKKCV